MSSPQLSSGPGFANGTPVGAPGGSGRTHPVPHAYAALDLGTNNCRMLVTRPLLRGTAERLSVIDSVSRTVSLGRDLERGGILSDLAMQRVLETMHVCADRLRRHAVTRMFLGATAACRLARNGGELVAEVERQTGLVLAIIPPELEARLALTSCAPLVDSAAEHLLVFDIGGGSTELIWIDLTAVEPAAKRRAVLELAPLRGQLSAGGALGARIVDWISVPLGVATLHQRFQDVAGEHARFALMSCSFEELVLGFAPAAGGSGEPGLQIIGTSGTVTTLAAAHLGLARYSRERVDGLWVGVAEIDHHCAVFLALSPEGRARHPAIGPQRATLIVAGIAILRALLRLWPVPRLRVADRGLREGMLYAMMHEDGLFAGGAI